jgi:4,5-dihydroxyphthalate decarboxylase
MQKLKLTLACWDYDRTRPLADGRVYADGVELDVRMMRPREIFPRMLEHQEFDVAEMSLASYVALKARGDCPFVAIPVALSKIFRHSCIYVRSDAGIRTARDLKGKRVGVTGLASTGLVFINGMLTHDYGVTPRDMHWFIGGLDEPAKHLPRRDTLARDLQIDFLDAHATLEEMFAAGELDAIISNYIPALFLNGSPQIDRLFPRYKEAEQDYYRRTRIFPIMHTVVMRAGLHREHPWLARNLYRAFCEARDMAVEGLYDTDALRLALPWLLDHVEETWRVFGKDFWANGLEANRPGWEAIGRYLHEQGLAPRVVAADELFVPDVE